MKITYFKSVNDTGTPYYSPIETAIDRIRTGKSKTIVENVRKEIDKTKRNLIKKLLPAICFSGEFLQRNDNSLTKHSGFICLDFDGYIDEYDMLQARNKYIADKYSFCVFTSPSGDGLKVIVKIPKDEKNHKNYFASLQKYYNCPEFDVTSKNLSRVCYESYDPEIYVNKDSVLFDTITVEEHQSFNKNTSRKTIKLNDQNEVIRRLNVWWNANFGLVPGARNNNTFVLAAAYNEYGVDKFEALSALSELASDDFPISEIKICLESAYKNFDAFGSKFFEDKDKTDSIKALISKGVPQEEVLKIHESLPSDIVKSVIENAESENVDSFWSKNSKGDVKHINHSYKQFLESNGIYKYYSPGSKNSVFIKTENNTLQDYYEENIKDYVLDYLIDKDDLSIYNYFADKTKLFKEDHLSFLGKVEPNIMKDTTDTAYLYYNNCALKITSDRVEVTDYLNIEGSIWSNEKLDRDFEVVDYNDCEFSRFISNISNHEAPRILSMRSTLGYMTHTYKSPSFSPAVILNDELISDNPEGGTGKGIYIHSISMLRPTVILDGKMFSFAKSFAYQRVQHSTKVLVWDDASKNFEFEKLFSVITEGITLEKKNKDEIHIPFERSPKIIISTNYAIKGTGNSFERRKWELEFAQHYNKNYTPRDEFGHDLFSDWDRKEWLKFDNYMVANIQMYLRNGLMKSDFKNLNERKFIAATSHDFYEWAKEPDNKHTKLGFCYSLQEMYNSFTEENPDFGRFGKYTLPLNKFGKWLDSWGEFRYGQKPDQCKAGAAKGLTFNRPTDETFDF
jgi:hypothetical protein